MYKAGDYKPVLDAFRPYIEFMQTIDAPVQPGSSSASLIVGGRTDWEKDRQARKGYLEELSNLLDQCFPGGEKRSKVDAMFRHLTLEYLNGFSSWSRMEEETKTVDLERNVEIIKKMRARLQAGERITDQGSLVGMLHLSTEDVLHPGKNMTLLELLASTTVNGKNGKPQPVAMMEKPAEEEIPF
jgi:hypothetical protein